MAQALTLKTARINIWTLDDDVVETDDKIVATFSV